MTDPRIFDRTPRAQFAERLEATFLRAAGAPHDGALPISTGEPLPDTTPEESIMTVQIESPDVRAREPRPRWTPLVGAAAAIVVIVALVAIVRSGNDEPATPTPVPVSFTAIWEYSDVRSECTQARECVNRFDIPARTKFTGDVAGNGFQALYWNDPVDYPGTAVDHLEHVGTYRIKGTVAGCGFGDFLLVEMMQFVSGPERDRDTGTYKGTWQIVPESGRGALATLSGSGTSDGLFSTATDKGREFTGTVTCDANG